MPSDFAVSKYQQGSIAYEEGRYEDAIVALFSGTLGGKRPYQPFTLPETVAMCNCSTIDHDILTYCHAGRSTTAFASTHMAAVFRATLSGFGCRQLLPELGLGAIWCD